MTGSGVAAPLWLDTLQQQLNDSVTHISAVGGGDFAQAYRVKLESGNCVFVKTHQHSINQFFITEAAGLSWLRATGTVAIPAVLVVADDPPLLALEWIETGQSHQQIQQQSPNQHRGDTEVEFGRALASLHQCSNAGFGRPDFRNTGSLGVPNQICQTWVEFYATQRLLPLARFAKDKRALSSGTIQQLDFVASRLPVLAADLGGLDEPPALLHGDLWAGNRIKDLTGQSWLVDPAAHFGHREFDLAMMRLFGGFSDACFTAYHETMPLADGHAARVSLHQLAPLVVHAIKFGGHYAQATADALSQYT